MSDAREWLIRKDGYYYRPNCSGYTTSKFEAGRYTKDEAEREAAVEPWHMKAIHEDDVEDDPVSSRVRMDGDRIATLAAEVERFRSERSYVVGWNDGFEHARAEASAAVKVKALNDAQIMEIIREVAPWKDEPKLNDLLTYEKSPPLFPQATYDVPSYRAEKFVRAVERRILSALTAEPAAPQEAEAVAWRCKDYADGWVVYGEKSAAERHQRNDGCLMQPLYAHPPTRAAEEAHANRDKVLEEAATALEGRRTVFMRDAAAVVRSMKGERP